MSSFFFPTVLTPAQYTTPSNQEFVLALGRTTIVNWTSTTNLTFVSLLAIGGNIDGMVVCFSNLNNNSNQLTCAHESSAAAVTAVTNRFHNKGLADVSGGTGAGALWYRYNAAVAGGRWIQIAGTT